MGNIIERRTEREYPIREQITRERSSHLEYIVNDHLNREYAPRNCVNGADRKVITIKKSKAIQNLCHINGQTIKYFPSKKLLIFECDCIKDSILNIYNSSSMEENIAQIEKSVFTKTILKSLQKEVRIELNVNLNKDFILEIKPKEIADSNILPTIQLTFCEQIKSQNAEDQGKIEIKRQCVLYNGKAFEIQNVYGLSNSSYNSSANSGKEKNKDRNKESEYCAICLINSREIILLPCRHACICSECSNILFKNAQYCPICRNPVVSVVKIENNIN